MELGYQKINAREYGSIAYELYGETGARLSGSEYDMHIKSQRVPIEPLSDLTNGDLTTVIYTQFADLKNAEQSVAPMFTYCAKHFVSLGNYHTLGYNDGSVVTEMTRWWQPSNIWTNDTLRPTTGNGRLGLYFGNELNEYDPSNPVSGLGLFNAFYRGTVAMMFDEDKRGVKYTAHLPLNVVMDLKVNDTLLINNKYHAVNSIETNYLTGESKLDLIMVGREKLSFQESYSRKVTNNHSTDDLVIIFIGASGYIEDFTIGAGGTLTYTMIGEILNFSHPDYLVELI